MRWSHEDDSADEGPPIVSEPIIEEDKAAEAENGYTDVPAQTPRKTKRNSYQRLSNLSDEARLSISSLTLSQDRKGTDSNRSSVTIKGLQVNGTNAGAANGTSAGGSLNDTEFDHALRKFATQRESFLADLDLTAGAIVPNRPRPRPKTQRIVNEETSGTRTGIGSIRRRLSTRNLNSAKRQPSVKRQCKDYPSVGENLSCPSVQSRVMLTGQ